MTLVNREAWHTASGVLLHGRIIEHSPHSEFSMAKVRWDNGKVENIPATLLILSKEAAEAACEQNIDYWEYAKERLNKFNY